MRVETRFEQNREVCERSDEYFMGLKVRVVLRGSIEAVKEAQEVLEKYFKEKGWDQF